MKAKHMVASAAALMVSVLIAVFLGVCLLQNRTHTLEPLSHEDHPSPSLAKIINTPRPGTTEHSFQSSPALGKITDRLDPQRQPTAHESLLFLELITQLRALSDEELEKEFGDCSRGDFKKSVYSRRMYEIDGLRCRRMDKKRDALKRSLPEDKREDTEISRRARQAIREEGFDLEEVYCRELLRETRPRIRAFLVHHCGFPVLHF